MRKLLIDPTKKAAQFRAVCKLPRWVPLDQLGDVDPDSTVNRWDRAQNCNVFAVECDFDTTDRAAFEKHMRELHDGGLYRWDDSTLNPEVRLVKTYSPRKPSTRWRIGKGAAEGAPFRPSTKAVEQQVERCNGCGLIAEVDKTEPSQLWWREHEVMCVGAQDVAS